MKKLLKSILFFKLNLFLPRKTKGAVVLMYHSISNVKAFFVVKPKEFEKQIKFLKQSGFSCILFSDLVKKLYAKESLENTVCVTFDDGYLDNFEVALPILIKYGIPASIFVSTGFMGKSRTIKTGQELPVMTKEMIKDISKNNLIECLPHGHMHKKMGTLNSSEVKIEVVESQMVLEELTGKRIPCFAYPYGDYTEETKSAISSLGIKGAVTVEEGIITHGLDPLELPRMTMSREVSFSEFRYKVSNATLYLSLIKFFK